jgi:hypothetical protein
MRTVLTTDLEKELDAALLTMLHENSELKGENAKLQARLDAMMTAFDSNGALGVLQKIMHDEDIKTELRIKAAGLAVGYETAKPASVVVQVDFRERVRNARLRQLELDRAEWARQDAAKLDLDGTTILGGPEADPAA